MKTILMTVAMAAAALAQGAPQDGSRTGERVYVQHEGAAGGTLLDMIDGTGGGWFYSMESGGGAMKVAPAKSEGGMTMKVEGGGSMKAGFTARRAGGTLLDLVDR